MQDIIEYTAKMKISGLIVFLDFQKAFNSIEWNFLQKTLEKFGFGTTFRKWIKLIYTNPVSSIKINGFLSKNININRGVKQGCPLSALFYFMHRNTCQLL